MGFFIWTCINFLPQFVLGIVAMILASGGLKNAWRVITKFPVTVLIPLFTFWVFGPITSCNSSCKGIKCKIIAERIEISFLSTWINILFTLSGALIFTRHVLGDNDRLSIFSLFHLFPFSAPQWIEILFDYWYLYFISLAILIVIFIQFVDYCNFSCCCNYCSSNCFPVKQLTYLDVNNMDDINITEEEIEMS